MRTFALLPIAVAALATTAAVGAWSLGAAISRVGASEPDGTPASIARPAGTGVADLPVLRTASLAFQRYRAEACSGDYVCRDGAWEPAEGASAESGTPAGEGL